MSKSIKKGSIIVVSAPSGQEKPVFAMPVTGSDKNTVYSVSATTRGAQRWRKDGVEYFFVSETQFKKMARTGKFAEWAKVHGNYYGTPKSFLNKTLKSGRNVLLDIDVQGGIDIKKTVSGRLHGLYNDA